MLNQSIKIKGSIKNIIFEKNNFYIFSIDKPEELKKYRNKYNNHLLFCKGFTDNALKIGDYLTINGALEQDEKYGYFFNSLNIHKSLIVTKDGFNNFLKSFKGLGKKKSDLISNFYISDISNSKQKFIFDIINNDENLKKIIGNKLFLNIQNQIKEMPEETLDDKETEFIQEFDIPRGIVNKIKKKNRNVITSFKKNAYLMAYDDKLKIKGIGFKTIDKVAFRIREKLEIKEEDFQNMRAKASIFFILKEREKDGHLFLRFNGIQYFFKTLNMESMEKDYFLNCVQELVDGNILIEEDKKYYINKNYDIEIEIANNIIERLKYEKKPINANIKYENGFTPSKKQEEAIKMALNENIMILTGGPGTGKTTISKYIFDRFNQNNLKIKIMAPTGTAARKIRQTIGYPATTIHRGLGIKFSEQNTGNNFLKRDVVLVDESSMIDIHIAKQLLNKVNIKTKLIFIGDVNQLPPVGMGQFLKDLKESKIPTVELDRVYRQDISKENPIVDFAYDVNNKIVNYYGNLKYKMDINNSFNILIKNNFNKRNNENYTQAIHYEAIQNSILYYKKFGLLDTQILTQLKVGQHGGSSRINKAIQESLNNNDFIPNTKYKIGDKIIQIRNNYQSNIFNGSIGIIKNYDKDTNDILIEFIDGDGTIDIYYNTISKDKDKGIEKNIDLAYRITIHKSQGQEFKRVLMVLNNYFFINKKMIYTGRTRTKEYLTILSNHSILSHGIKTEYGIVEINGKLVEVKRNTSLKDRILYRKKLEKLI